MRLQMQEGCRILFLALQSARQLVFNQDCCISRLVLRPAEAATCAEGQARAVYTLTLILNILFHGQHSSAICSGLRPHAMQQRGGLGARASPGRDSSIPSRCCSHAKTQRGGSLRLAQGAAEGRTRTRCAARLACLAQCLLWTLPLSNGLAAAPRNDCFEVAEGIPGK